MEIHECQRLRLLNKLKKIRRYVNKGMSIVTTKGDKHNALDAVDIELSKLEREEWIYDVEKMEF